MIFDELLPIIEEQLGSPFIPSRPNEFVCLYPIDLTTPRNETEVFMYVAVDAYSDFVYDLGVEKMITDELVIEKIGQLLEHKDFNKGQQNFTLALHKFEHLQIPVETLIKPLGKVLFSDAMVTYVVSPFLESLFKHLSTK